MGPTRESKVFYQPSVAFTERPDPSLLYACSVCDSIRHRSPDSTTESVGPTQIDKHSCSEKTVQLLTMAVSCEIYNPGNTINISVARTEHTL
jgi:hypothetical protein